MTKSNLLTKDQQIILASSSSTRIKQIKKHFKNVLITKHLINENEIKKKYKSSNLVCLLAQKKAESIKDLYPKKIIIGSDQILICQNKEINKPKNINEAKKNMLYLRNKYHTLLSAIYVLNNNKFYYKEKKTAKLFFKNISEHQIDNYLHKNKETALSSIGSYKIEDNDKYNFIKIINGDLETILGFPVKKFISKILSNG
jgi:septum formation protein